MGVSGQHGQRVNDGLASGVPVEKHRDAAGRVAAVPRIHQEVPDLPGVVADGGRQLGDVQIVGNANDQGISVVHRGHVPLSSSSISFTAALSATSRINSWRRSSGLSRVLYDLMPVGVICYLKILSITAAPCSTVAISR